ncbi:putative receptor binding protein assembly chaperone [Campylobacter phage F341]|nr:putative receptor binding protein assembly chaperone [Campylobacter phage F341]
MKYFIDKNDNNQLYAYKDNTEDKFIKPGLTPITEEEFNTITNPTLTPEQLLTKAKLEKYNEIKVKQDSLIEGVIDFEGRTFQTRLLDKVNISGKINEIVLDQASAKAITKVGWIDIDNEPIEFTVDKFLEFAAAVAKQTEAIAFKANILKAKIEAAKTIEELEKIQWDDDPVKTTSQKKR